MRRDRCPGRWCRTIAAILLPWIALAGAAEAAALPVEYDLLVVGGSPAGIACAVRAARQGLNVMLVERTEHLGGFMSSGAGGWEAPYDGGRSPLYDELLQATADYYRSTYGADSPQRRASLPQPTGNRHIDRPKVEPRVIELLFDRLTAAEGRLTVLRGYVPVSVERDGRSLRFIVLEPSERQPDAIPIPDTKTVSARMFADATYEGDLLALAGASYRVGREARAEYNEPHAGVIFCTSCPRQPGQRGFPLDADQGRLRLRMFPMCNEVVAPRSTGAADRSVMAYNYRLILTNDPDNRVANPQPLDYDPQRYRGRVGEFKAGSIVPNLPNRKIAWNAGRLVGPQNDYPEADWPTRKRISRQYLDAVLGLLWFLQHDESVPVEQRAQWQQYGLARDEFSDNGHLPYEIYVREARRLIGRALFTEHDGCLAEGLQRTPIHHDSVAITDWPMDSVACTAGMHGAGHEGAFFLSSSSRPAQVPYRCLLPRELDNLLVPLCVSATHVGWGAIRLEPVWMQLGESAGFAAALAVKYNCPPAAIDSDALVRQLAEAGMCLALFNDVDARDKQDWTAAIQYLGTKGFFASYDARPIDQLDAETAMQWSQHCRNLLRQPAGDATLRARKLPREPGGPPVTAGRFAAMLLAEPNAADGPVADWLTTWGTDRQQPLTRGDGCRMVYQLVQHARQEAPRTVDTQPQPDRSDAPAERLNVLFVAVDDLRPALGCYGDTHARTPHIDRLAARGTVFERAYCQQAVCSPSRLSLLTGLRPDTIAVWDLKTHFRATVPDAVTLPQHFRQHGYRTVSLGKIFHGNGPPAKDPASWSEPPQFDLVERAYVKPNNLTGTGGKAAATEMADVADDAYTDGQVCSAAEEALERLAAADQPFFLAVGFRKPHLPFAAPQRYWDLYNAADIPPPPFGQHPRGAPEWATRSWLELEGYRDIGKGAPIPPEKVRHLRHGYYACVSYVDALVGRLLDALQRQQLADRTVIVLWGDHGYHLGEQGLWTKANNFELSTRVPLIVVVPGQSAPGSRTVALVELVDVYPTLAEVCGLPVPDCLEGSSFRPLLDNPQQSWKPAAFSQYPRDRQANRHSGRGHVMGYTLRNERYRYVEWRDLAHGAVLARELYDHTIDPAETQNLADEIGRQALLAELAAQLAAGWQAARPPRNEE